MEARALVVVGAAAGMGRWLCEHVLSGGEWSSVQLVDTADVTDVAKCFSGPVSSGGEVPAGAAVVVAVPREVIAEVAPSLAPAGVVCGVSDNQGLLLAELRRRLGSTPVVGLHPLLETTARSADGHTFLIVPDDDADASWLADLVVSAGGTSKTVSAADHDRAMAYVQTMAHQALLGFVDAVTGSGIELQELWELRTPLFEALFGLAVRVISENQQTTIAEIQTSTGGEAVAAELDEAAARLDAALAGGTTGVEAAIEQIRDRFDGSLFDTIRTTAAAALSATQGKRAQLARHRRLGDVVGLRRLDRPDVLRVGRIVEVTPVSVTLREVMFGKRGDAAFVDGPGRRNAKKVGVTSKPRDTAFALGHVDVVIGPELDAALDEWLAFIRRDVRFLVPESVAGDGVLTFVANAGGVRDAEVVSEVVRTGQRSVVIRVLVRADHDVEDAIEALRAQVQAAYGWPRGVSLPASGIEAVHYLGPPGTFSEAAALHALRAAGVEGAELVAEDSFDTILDALSATSIGLLPVSSSASGVVVRAVEAVLRHGGPLVAGGVVDVPVRFDAYIAHDAQLADLRGAVVYSHPQALSQCTGFIARWGLEPVPCASTTEPLTRITEGDARAVAIAPADAVHGSGIKVAEREIDDLPGSITRFLILGRPGCFGELVGGSDPTLRSIWIAPRIDALFPLFAPGAPAFDELLSSGDGSCLWVTSRLDAGGAGPGARFLGRAPWSPRTPVVRVEVAVPPDR